MAGTELKIDDEYVTEMGKYFIDKGEELQGYIDKYIQILDKIRTDAIIEGDTAKALDEFIGFSKNLNVIIQELGKNAKKQSEGFAIEIDKADSYLF